MLGRQFQKQAGRVVLSKESMELLAAFYTRQLAIGPLGDDRKTPPGALMGEGKGMRFRLKPPARIRQQRA